MVFLLDSNAVSDLINENPKVDARLAALRGPARVVSCPIVNGEILFGIERLPPGKRRDALLAKALKVLSGLPCEPITENASVHYARLKHAYRQAGVAMDENDFWIAAMTADLGAVLVTRDGDFQRVPGLVVEDWSV